MDTVSPPPSAGGVHFAIPEGTASITQPNPATGEGHDSWREWGQLTIVLSVAYVYGNDVIRHAVLQFMLVLHVPPQARGC